MDFRDVSLEENPERKANPISRLFVLWVFPLLRKGSKKDLNFEDLFRSLPEDSSAKLGSAFER